LKAFFSFLAAYVLSQFYRSFLAVIAPEFSHELHLDPQSLGALQACWIGGFVLMQFPVGWALDTLGPRRSISALMALAVIGAGLFARATSAAELDVAMALIGVGCSSIYMGAIYYFGRVYPRERFAFFSSFLLGLGSAGNLLAASPMSMAASSIGWRAAMGVIALATAVSAVGVYMSIEDPPPAAGRATAGLLSGLFAVLSLRPLWLLLPITAVSYSVILAERGLWAGPFFADVYGLGPAARGNALLAMAAAMSLGALGYGPLDRILGTRKWIVVGGSALTAACFLALGLFDVSLAGAVALLAALGFFGLTYGVLMAHGRALFEDRLLGRGITTMNILFIGGAGILQPISGAYMKAMGALPPAQAYGRLHLTFGVLLLVALAIYVVSEEKPAAAAAAKTAP